MADNKTTAAQLSVQNAESEKRVLARIDEVEKRLATSFQAQLEQIRVENAAMLTAILSISVSAPKRTKAETTEKTAEGGDKPADAPKISTTNVMTWWKSSYKAIESFREAWNNAEFKAKLESDEKCKKAPADFSLAANTLYPLVKNDKTLTERAKDEFDTYKKTMNAPAAQAQAETEPGSPR